MTPKKIEAMRAVVMEARLYLEREPISGPGFAQRTRLKKSIEDLDSFKDDSLPDPEPTAPEGEGVMTEAQKVADSLTVSEMKDYANKGDIAILLMALRDDLKALRADLRRRT